MRLTHEGFPVLDGLPAFLNGVRGLMAYRDFRARPAMRIAPADEDAVAKWSSLLARSGQLDEASSLAMLADFGIATSRSVVLDSADDLHAAARSMRYPLVLKTAVEGIAHKTERKGVILGIDDEESLAAAWADLSSRLGPRALLTEMASSGIDMILGARQDPQFGPVVMLGFGGTLAEVVKDVSFLMPPFDAASARRHIDRLRLRPLLDGVRGAPPADIASFCEMAARFSVMVHSLRGELRELDVNPVIVGENHCIAVDALVVGSHREEER